MKLLLSAAILLTGCFFASCDSQNVNSQPEKTIGTDSEITSQGIVNNDKHWDSITMSSRGNKSIGFDSARQVVLFEKGVTVRLPAGFSQADENAIIKKYPQETRRPQILFTSKDKTADIAFNYTPVPARPEDLQLLKTKVEQSFEASIINVISSKITKVNGKDFIIQEYVSPSEKGNIKNLSYISVLRGRLLMCNFNYLQKDSSIWELSAHKTMNSIKLKL